MKRESGSEVKEFMKYQNTNPLEKLQPGEPYFFIRAQDKLSVDAVTAYAESAQARIGAGCV